MWGSAGTTHATTMACAPSGSSIVMRAS
jgi:hypothetical protein